MKTKEEVIKEAWGVLYNDKTDKNGWLTVGFNYEYNHNDFDTIRYLDCVQIRPKQLQGIENNNEWIKIESEKDLPTLKNISDEIHCFIKSSESELVGIGKFSFGTFKTFFGNNYDKVTHYQPIIKPQPPLY